ncbi:MAG: hypothetical protein IPK75_17050 [Acidobacteria bacterium]|jgi:uncharacterized phiE125 gp8 family phage protein|nr:hypothetical protein [Acidobacteriota bacterium]
MTDLTVITPPAEEPLTLAAAKDFLRLGTNAEDALVGELIKAGRAQVEASTGLALVERTLKRRWAAWPHGLLRGGVKLRPGPAKALVSVVRVDAEGGEELLTGRFTLLGGRLRLRPFAGLPVVPLGGAIEVTFVAGYGAAADVPEDLVHAVKLWGQAAYLAGGDRRGGVPDELAAVLAGRREVRL